MPLLRIYSERNTEFVEWHHDNGYGWPGQVSMHARDKCPSFPWHLARRASHCIALHRLHGTLFVVLTAALLSASSSMPLLIHTRVIIIKIYVAEKKNRNHIKQRVRRQRRGQTKQKMQNACSSQFAMRFVVPALWLRRCFVCLSTANPNRRSVYGYLNGKCSVGGVLRTHTPAPGTIAPYIKHL